MDRKQKFKRYDLVIWADGNNQVWIVIDPKRDSDGCIGVVSPKDGFVTRPFSSELIYAGTIADLVAGAERIAYPLKEARYR